MRLIYYLCELRESLATCDKKHNTNKWLINDLCILPNNDEIFKIGALARQCRLYDVNDLNQSKAIEEVIQKFQPNQYVKVIIENDEDDNDKDRQLFITLLTENNQNINDLYRSGHANNDKNTNENESNNEKNNEMIPSNLSNSIITVDHNKKKNNDLNSTSTTDIARRDSIFEENYAINLTQNILFLVKSNSKTIDYDANGGLLAANKTTKYETNDSI